jgi:hypothetical protein
MTRLLARATSRSADPELFAGLVQACRYAGLCDASIAAHARARRLDPSIRTSVAHAYLMNGDYRHDIEKDIAHRLHRGRRRRSARRWHDRRVHGWFVTWHLEPHCDGLKGISPSIFDPADTTAATRTRLCPICGQFSRRPSNNRISSELPARKPARPNTCVSLLTGGSLVRIQPEDVSEPQPWEAPSFRGASALTGGTWSSCRDSPRPPNRRQRPTFKACAAAGACIAGMACPLHRARRAGRSGSTVRERCVRARHCVGARKT